LNTVIHDFNIIRQGSSTSILIQGHSWSDIRLITTTTIPSEGSV